MSGSRGEKDCGKGPTGFERITEQYDWILNNTEDATYCNNPFWYKNKPEKEENDLKTELNQQSSAKINSKFNFIVEFSFTYLQLTVTWLL